MLRHFLTTLREDHLQEKKEQHKWYMTIQQQISRRQQEMVKDQFILLQTQICFSNLDNKEDFINLAQSFISSETI